MAENIISHNHNDTLINQRYKDGYINLTAMAQANGKLIADYLRLDSTNAFLAELSRSMGIPIDLESPHKNNWAECRQRYLGAPSGGYSLRSMV
jgi:hypothetical protein